MRPWAPAGIARGPVRGRPGMTTMRLIAEAVAALRKVLPDLPEKEAVREVILAIAYAAREPTYWFWTGVGGR